MELNDVIAAFSAVVFERLDDGRFRRRSSAPRWWGAAMREREDEQQTIDLREVFPFLQVFLPDAQRAWAESGPPIVSEMWTQTDERGLEIHLQAFAARVDARPALLIVQNDLGFTERQLLLQRARELRITYDALMREIERKDILLHTIVHDLTAPLHSILGSLSLLREVELPQKAARWAQLAVEAAARQRALIQDILDVFVTEHGGGQSPLPSGIDLKKAVDRATAEREPVAVQRQIKLVADVPGSWLVVADETRLIRVLTNLLDNAIKHSPSGKEVRLTARPENSGVLLRVDDEGPGVSTDLLPRLFQKLVRDPRGGGSGLGLYFCRIAVEQWGGGIGYDARASGGSSFWIRVKRSANG